jgi:hypothetical protein
MFPIDRELERIGWKTDEDLIKELRAENKELRATNQLVEEENDALLEIIRQLNMLDAIQDILEAEEEDDVIRGYDQYDYAIGQLS